MNIASGKINSKSILIIENFSELVKKLLPLVRQKTGLKLKSKRLQIKRVKMFLKESIMTQCLELKKKD